MEELIKLSDSEFERQFANCSLNPRLFSHLAHIRLTWVHIKKYGVDKAIENVCVQIKKFDATHDDGTKFHTTLTVASVRTVHHFILKSETNTFKEFITEFPRLENNFKDLIAAHYSLDRLTSLKSKQEYLVPDLLPYD